MTPSIISQDSQEKLSLSLSLSLSQKNLASNQLQQKGVHHGVDGRPSGFFCREAMMRAISFDVINSKKSNF